MKNLILKPLARDHWHLTDTQKMCLDLSLLIPKSKDDLFMFVVDRKCTIQHAKQMAKQLFADPEASDYLAERQKWIDEEWFGKKDEENEIEARSEMLEQRKKELDELRQYVRMTDEERAMYEEKYIDSKIKNLESLDTQEAKLILDKTSKKDISADEKPRIYVPLKCSICTYREFCETQGKSVCPKCKFRAFALEHGSQEWDYTEMLIDYAQ